MKTKLSQFVRFLPVAVTLLCVSDAQAAEKLKALIVDGQNNHEVWPKSTIMMKRYLEETGLFEVDVERTKFLWKAGREKDFLPLAGAGEGEDKKKPQADPDFSPEFDKYDVVVSNFGYNAADWPEETRRNLEKFMKEGGGLVVVHAANNSWAKWPEFNKMIGLGGWGGRNEKSGPYVYINDKGEEVRDPAPGPCGKHGPQSEFVVTMRVKDHPITKGMPDFWMHGRDECYSMLRGPAENMTILATAADTPKLKNAGRNEPMLMVIDYHKGRVFNTTLGHDTPAFESVGFINTFTRGTEWAATGKVTIPVADNFPGPDKPVLEKFEVKK
ncbi:ThuA domain-containing protein [Haloferula chungangensis]|uniref:ThuA domain-containing protein n=1 Tax=Haloferula chungangensis TaxID=1048331 RepID=A0ABW2L7Q2_9BACT